MSQVLLAKLLVKINLHGNYMLNHIYNKASKQITFLTSAPSVE